MRSRCGKSKQAHFKLLSLPLRLFTPPSNIASNSYEALIERNWIDDTFKMPPTRHPSNPFDSVPPLQPTHSNVVPNNATLRNQSSQHSLRSNASAASSRPRQQRDLFAPSRSRRPTGRATPHVEDEVLADPDTEEELTAAQHRQRQLRRVRHGSPESKHGRSKVKQTEAQDFVNRQPDGSYLLGVAGFGETSTIPQMSAPITEGESDQAGRHASYSKGNQTERKQK
jgi:hypothetical protein